MGIQLLQGDCLELMKDIPDGSVDMVLCDLPYGTTRNRWDSVIPLEKLLKGYLRILKSNGVICLHTDQPFTADVVKTFRSVWRYELVWVKELGSGSTGVACVNTDRNFIGMELDHGYFETAQRRIQEAQNGPPVG